MARVLDRGGPHRRRRIAAATELGGSGNGGGEGLGFGAGKPVGHGSEREEGAGGRADKDAREARIAGTWPEDGRRRRRVRAARGAKQRGGRERVADRWARRGFSFSFHFFFRAVTAPENGWNLGCRVCDIWNDSRRWAFLYVRADAAAHLIFRARRGTMGLVAAF